ncbi:MAG: ABC transporter permease [Archangium sp.]|nr:ABC transporter permease [Archangium sp.]MDP3575369.1 ABC transporter permease [Archangium sp.]
MNPLLSMALRNVLRNRRRTLITLAAVTIGVAAVGTIRGVLNGLQQSIVRGSIEGTLGAIQVHRTGYLANVLSTPLSLDFEADEALLGKVRSVKGVKAIAPRIQFAGSLTLSATEGNDAPEALFFGALAVDPLLEPKVCPQRSTFFTDGTVLDDTHVVLGDALAAAFGAKNGAEAILLAPDRDGSLNGELAFVGGAMRAIMPGEMKIAVVPLSLAQRLLRMDGRVTELAIAVDDLTQVVAIAEQLRVVLGPAYEVHTWEELAPERKTIMGIQNGVSAVVSGVFMMLMLLGVANTMLMSVLERTREVGTMMAVGLTRGSVLWLFLLEALVLGAMGAGGGFLLMSVITLGLASKGIHFTPPSATMAIEVIPFLTPGFTVVVLFIAMGGAVLFALYPAFRASRLRPVQALAGR